MDRDILVRLLRGEELGCGDRMWAKTVIIAKLSDQVIGGGGGVEVEG